MNETMEKVLEENQEKPQEGLLEIVHPYTVSVCDASLPDAGNAIPGPEHSTVSGGDLFYISPLNADLTVQADAVQALAEHMASLDFRVSCILFLILFIWCEKKIRNAVANMTGRRVRV